MKNNKIIGWLTSFMILIGAVVIPAIPTEAGLSNKIIDTTVYETEIDSAEWYNQDEDITVQKGVLTFPKNSTSGTKLISKSIIGKSTQLDKMLSAQFTVKFSELPEGEKFVFAVGLQSLGADLSQKGNVELAFFNEKDSCMASLSAFTENGVENQLVQKTSCGKGSMNVVVEVDTNQSIKVTVGGRKIYSGSIPVSGEGSVGFLQTGSCGAQINNFVVHSYSYNTPESPSFVEDFETGYFNTNILYSTMISGTGYSPSDMIIEEHNGSKVLKYRSIGLAYIGTKYAYSNFELTFDVPYFQVENQHDENGQVLVAASSELGLTFGSDGFMHTNESGYVSAAEGFFFTGPGKGYRFSNKETMLPATSLETQNGGFSVRLTVIDGLVTLGVKELHKKEYQTLVQYQLDETPTGNILLWAPSGRAATYAIDNIKLVNKDVDGKDFEVEYKSSKIEVPEDFAYEPLGLEYRPSDHQEVSEDMNRWLQPVPIVLFICLFALSVTILVCVLRLKKEREV